MEHMLSAQMRLWISEQNSWGPWLLILMWRQWVCQARTHCSLHHLNLLLHTGPEQFLHGFPGFLPEQTLRRGRLVGWTKAPMSTVEPWDVTVLTLSLLHFSIYIPFLSSDSLGRSWWLALWYKPNFYPWNIWMLDYHSLQSSDFIWLLIFTVGAREY